MLRVVVPNEVDTGTCQCRFLCSNFPLCFTFDQKSRTLTGFAQLVQSVSAAIAAAASNDATRHKLEQPPHHWFWKFKVVEVEVKMDRDSKNNFIWDKGITLGQNLAFESVVHPQSWRGTKRLGQILGSRWLLDIPK